MIRFEESLDRAFLQRMYDAGCYSLFFGLESMSQAMQDVIKKGTQVDVVWRTLRDCKEIGIKVHLFFILGIPGETEADMMESLNFMRNHPDLYETLQIAQFELLVGSPIYLKPERYGVENLEVVSDHARLAYSEVAYDRVRGLTHEEITAYYEETENDELIYRKNIWSGYGFTIYQPDPPVLERPKDSKRPVGQPRSQLQADREAPRRQLGRGRGEGQQLQQDRRRPEAGSREARRRGGRRTHRQVIPHPGSRAVAQGPLPTPSCPTTRGRRPFNAVARRARAASCRAARG
jgi:radical SAM superfamily enzyme YgiQ (UPF0313 family)